MRRRLALTICAAAAIDAFVRASAKGFDAGIEASTIAAGTAPGERQLMRRESLVHSEPPEEKTHSLHHHQRAPALSQKHQRAGIAAAAPISLADSGGGGRIKTEVDAILEDQESEGGGEDDHEDSEDREFALRHGLPVPSDMKVIPMSMIEIDDLEIVQAHDADGGSKAAEAAEAESSTVSCGGGRRAKDCGRCAIWQPEGPAVRTHCGGDCFWTYGSGQEQQCAPLPQNGAAILETAEATHVLTSLRENSTVVAPAQSIAARALQASIELHLKKNMQNLVSSDLDTSNKKPVWCGGHGAYDCASCGVGHGASWCNGDCEWIYGACKFREDLVWCGTHSAATCYFCSSESTQNAKEAAYRTCGGDENADCEWHFPGYCRQKERPKDTGWNKVSDKGR